MDEHTRRRRAATTPPTLSHPARLLALPRCSHVRHCASVSAVLSALELRVGSVLIGFEHVRRVVLLAAPQLVHRLQAEDEQARQLILPLHTNR